MYLCQDRGKLKQVFHGCKLSKLGIPCPQIESVMLNFGSLLLCNISYEIADKSLISTFVKRWHQDINTFHLFVGEMTIMLNDVFTLLHIPIVGQYCGYVSLDFTLAYTYFVEFLKVDTSDAMTKLMNCCSPHVRLNWMRQVYKECYIHHR